MKKTQILQLAGGLLIMVAGIYFFIKQVNDLGKLWLELKATKIWIVIAVALLSPLAVWLRAVRWNIILPQQPDAQRKGFFSLVMIGFMANNLLPARLGEALRAVLLWKRNRFTVAQSVGSLIVERFIDTVVFAFFFSIPVFMKSSLASLHFWAILMSVVCVVVAVVMALYARFPEQIQKLIFRMVGFLPQKFSISINKIVVELISNLNWLLSFKKAFAVVSLSFLIMVPYSMMFYLLGLKIDAFGVLDSMFGIAVAAIGTAIPLAPGYMGTMHATLMYGFSLLGIAVEKAGALVLLYHSIGYVTVTVLGLICFFNTKMSFKDITKAKRDLGNLQQVNRT
ncbi:MAG: flippase-like domain-containing protein [Fibrobacter sp.]|nr:flippase-like domain-containing protein [Fibrobacter sp.]